MKHQCPNCQSEYNEEVNFCPKCGKSSQASPKNFAKDMADKHETIGGSSASNVTSHMDEFFPSNPRRVEPSPDAKGGARTVNAKQHQETVKDSEPSLSPSLDHLNVNPAYHSSVRKLSVAVIIGNGLTTLGIIGLALIFTLSQQRTQEHLMAFTEKFGATNEILRAYVQQSNAREEKSDAEIAILKQDNAARQQESMKQEQATIAIQDSLKKMNEQFAEMKKMNEQFAEQRLAAMPMEQRKRVINTADSNLASIYAKTTDITAKRAIEDFRRDSLNPKELVKVFKGYDRMAAKLDERTRSEIDAKVRKPLMGE